MRRALVVPICLLLIPLASSQAAETPFVNDAEPPLPSSFRESEPWREGPTRLPPWPNEADLVEFTPDGAADSFRYFIDGRHLEVGSDEVVRYTLVAESRSGTRNFSVEGIRCTPRGQFKVFAYGTAGRFTPLQGGDWQPISQLDTADYRKDLWRFHFCIPREFEPRPIPDMLRSLRGRIATHQNTGFQAD